MEWACEKRFPEIAQTPGDHGPALAFVQAARDRGRPCSVPVEVLASALRVLSNEFRNERMMRAEEKAARLPAIMTVPLILFILPVLFVVILGPAACSINDALMSG